MQSEALQGLWREWLTVGEGALKLLHEETAALMLKDPQRVKRIRPELERTLAKLTGIDARALRHAKALADELGIQPDYGSLFVALGKVEAEELLGLSNRVRSTARTIEGVIQKNRKLFREELLPHMRAKADCRGRAAVLMG